MSVSKRRPRNEIAAKENQNKYVRRKTAQQNT